MKQHNSSFPWHYYVRIIRSKIVLIIISAIATYTIATNSTEYIFLKILTVIAILIIYAIIQGYYRIIPIKNLLKRVTNLQLHLPHNKRLDIIYKKNEWFLIEEMLKLTEKYIKEQSEYIHSQHVQSHTLIDSIPECVVIVDEFDNCLSYNKSFKENIINGQESINYENEKLWKVIHNPIILEALQEIKSSPLPVTLKGQQILNNYYNVSMTPIQEQKRKIFLCIFHNITESKLIEKMRVDFVANVSHEIRTPLTSIKGFSQLLLSDQKSLDEKVKLPLERIVHNVERLKDLFDNLLHLSVLEAKQQIHKEQIDFHQMCKSIFLNIQAKYPKKKITSDFKISGHIYADRKLLEQVITNLFDNAVKYSQREDIQLKVHHVITREANSSITKIQDNGPGINESELSRIFERFYRTQNHSNSTIDGSGLGLSIVKHVINRHNGEISVSSSKTEGTCFTIVLPLE